MNCEFKRKLPIPMEIKKRFPITEELAQLRKERDETMKRILSGEDERRLLIIGPCSADNEESVLEYVHRLVGLQEQVQDAFFIVPRVYSNKPRTTGEGYKGMLHQPDPTRDEDVLEGLIKTRQLHLRVLQETGFTCADEMLYPENYRYFSDLLGYAAVGARSVEDQQHRLTASALDVPVGMKNPTSGDRHVLFNALRAAQQPHIFIYRGWDVESKGNPYAHAILRGSVNSRGQVKGNYHYEDLIAVHKEYIENGLTNPGVIIDTNHANSNKQYLEQGRIAMDVLESCAKNPDIHRLVKGFMIESYLVDGCQAPGGEVYGQSITDPCLGWDKTEKLVVELAEKMRQSSRQ